ncbi:MAG: metalloregulator ArsR/SmtB family transcription factor [Candidatus Aminicenantes bacterium]|jgi:ArsR family transcriptional regulator
MKKKRYSKEHEELSRKFRALSHPARVKLVEDLMKKEFCVGEMQKFLSLSQPNVSQHLKVLREAGIIRGRREKTKICYSIADDNVCRVLLLFLKGDESNE